MNLSPLIEKLSTWKGRQCVQKEMESRGFTIPGIYQRYVISSCGSDTASGIETYWDEYAKEWICSRGWGNPNLRVFKGEHTYRSKYLDDLALNFDYKGSPLRNPPIHPCIFSFEMQRRIQGFGNKIVAMIDDAKELEIKNFELSESESGWTGLKRDVAPILKKFIEARGFQRNGRFFTKKMPSGLLFSCYVDSGGKEYTVDLSLRFLIQHENDIGLTFEVGHFDILVPGFSYYKLYKTPKSAILGIYAHAEMFDVLSGSFEEGNLKRGI